MNLSQTFNYLLLPTNRDVTCVDCGDSDELHSHKNNGQNVESNSLDGTGVDFSYHTIIRWDRS